MTRKEEIINYSNSFKGDGMENEELKEIIRLAIIDGAMWADANPNMDAFIEKAWDWIEDNLLSSNQYDKSFSYYKQFKNYMKGE